MATSPLRITTARDDEEYSYDLSNAIYGHFPSCATSIPPPQRSRATSPNSAKKRKPIAAVHRPSASPNWLPQPNTTISLFETSRRTQGMSIHASTCLNLNMAASGESSESDLWILPELDDWEEDAGTETESSQGTLSPSSSASETAPQPPAGQNKWAGIFRRAANSNLDRLRTRLEGDGWDFVGGTYGDERATVQKAANQDQESLDEEFDVVVLSRGERRG